VSALKSSTAHSTTLVRDMATTMSQVTCGDHVKWITDEKSRKDRSVSKGETMGKENGRDLKEES